MQNSQFLELQPALITKFMKKILKEDQFLLSAGLKQKFSRALTVFLHYVFTLAAQIAKEKHRVTVSVEDLKKALEEAGFEEPILLRLESKVLSLGGESQKNRRNRAENSEKEQKPADFLEEEEEEEQVLSDAENLENAENQGNIEK